MSFFNRVIFLLLSWESNLYILNTSPVSDMWVANILFHFMGFLFPFIFLQDLSSQTKDWTWALAVRVPSPSLWTTREFPLSTFFMMEYKHFLFWWYLIFLLYVVHLVSYLRNHCLIQMHNDFTYFSSKSCLVLVLTFRSMMHFQLFLLYAVKFGSKCHYFAHDHSAVPAPFNYLGTLVEIN